MAISSRQCPQGYQIINGVCNEFGDVSSPCMAQCANLHPSNCGYSSFNDSCNCSCCQWYYTGPPPNTPDYNPQPHQYNCSCSGCWTDYNTCVTSCQGSSWHGGRGSRIGVGGASTGGRGGFGGRRTGGKIRRRR